MAKDLPLLQADLDSAVSRRCTNRPCGGPSRLRSDHLLLAGQVLYQLSYEPETQDACFALSVALPIELPSDLGRDGLEPSTHGSLSHIAVSVYNWLGCPVLIRGPLRPKRSALPTELRPNKSRHMLKMDAVLPESNRRMHLAHNKLCCLCLYKMAGTVGIEPTTIRLTGGRSTC